MPPHITELRTAAEARADLHTNSWDFSRNCKKPDKNERQAGKRKIRIRVFPLLNGRNFDESRDFSVSGFVRTVSAHPAPFCPPARLYPFAISI